MDQRTARRQLRTMQRRATALLVVVVAAFAAVLVAAPDGVTWVGYAIAACEGSLVGGLADWFAVTALFRHPLGIPIPHTAIIRKRKDQFGATLGSFVQESFLSPDNVAERVRAAGVGDRVAAWLVRDETSVAAAQTLAEGAVGLLDLFADEDVARLLHEEMERAAGAVAVAPIAGRALKLTTADGRHQALLDIVLRGVRTFLDEHRDVLRERFEAQSPWWLPGALEDKLFDRIVDGAGVFLDTVVADPEHELRATFDERVVEFADRLQHDPDLRARGEEMKRELLAHPDVRAWTSGMWTQVKEALRTQSGDPDSELRRRIAGLIVAGGRRLQEDDALRAKVSEVAEKAACYVAEHYRDEIGDLITATVARWDGAETSDRLELLLGRDLQFIRINGTVVGGLAGVAIHAATEVLR